MYPPPRRRPAPAAVPPTFRQASRCGSRASMERTKRMPPPRLLVDAAQCDDLSIHHHQGVSRAAETAWMGARVHAPGAGIEHLGVRHGGRPLGVQSPHDVDPPPRGVRAAAWQIPCGACAPCRQVNRGSSAAHGRAMASRPSTTSARQADVRRSTHHHEPPFPRLALETTTTSCTAASTRNPSASPSFLQARARHHQHEPLGRIKEGPQLRHGAQALHVVALPVVRHAIDVLLIAGDTARRHARTPGPGPPGGGPGGARSTRGPTTTTARHERRTSSAGRNQDDGHRRSPRHAACHRHGTQPPPAAASPSASIGAHPHWPRTGPPW